MLEILWGSEWPKCPYKAMGIFSTERNLYFFLLNCLATCVECAHGVSGYLVKCLKFPGGNERPQCCYKTLGIFSTERNLLFFILNCPATSVECAHGVSGHLVKCLKFHWGNKKPKCSYKTMMSSPRNGIWSFSF